MIKLVERVPLFLRRSICEKIWEDLKVLTVYQRRIRGLYYPEKNTRYLQPLGKFYIDQFKEINEKLRKIVNKNQTFVKKNDEVCNLFETINFYSDEVFLKAAEISADISKLTSFYMYLDRALRHRSPLFGKNLELLYPAHYAFQPFYKLLLACDSICWESIKRSYFNGAICLISYFGERETSTVASQMIIPELFLKYEPKNYLFELNNKFQSSLYSGNPIDLEGLRLLGFISIPRHSHTHSRCTIFNVHEVIHNIIFLLCYSNIFRVPDFKDRLVNLAIGLFRSVERSELDSEKAVCNLVEIICDLASTALTGHAYNLASISSDQYRLWHEGGSDHPPDVVRNYACMKYAHENLGYTGNATINNTLEQLERLVTNRSKKRFPGYSRFLESNSYWSEIKDIIRTYIVREPFTQGETVSSLEIMNHLDDIAECEYPPSILLNSIWFKRLTEDRLNDSTSPSNYGGIKRHGIEVFVAMKKWLELQVSSD